MDYSKVFHKVDAMNWKGETANFALAVKKNGHVGYWMVLTNKATGKASAPRYGKHFKALASWVAKFEEWAREETAKYSMTQSQLEASCPDFYAAYSR